MAKRRPVARALADELGLTTPKAVQRKKRPAKKRVRAKSFRAAGD
jgi:hypothetical protein